MGRIIDAVSSLIEELQRDALDAKVPVTELLQKCLVVGAKLRIQKLTDWARLELDGYKDTPIPEYREVGGFPQAFNPVRGHQQYNSEVPNTFVSSRPCHLTSRLANSSIR
jgi:hypothetical protein